MMVEDQPAIEQGTFREVVWRNPSGLPKDEGEQQSLLPMDGTCPQTPRPTLQLVVQA